MAVQTDFLAAVNQISAERGIDRDEVLQAVAEAIKLGFKKNLYEENLQYNNEEIEEIDNINVNIDPEAGQISVLQEKEVVEKPIDKNIEISIKDAKKINPNVEIGDIVEFDITPSGDFGRVAAQAAKHVILQKIRESEREKQIEVFKDRLGGVEYAVVQRMRGDDVLWEVGKTTAVMPKDDRIATEYYKSGSRHKVLLKKIIDTARGKTLIVSRSDPNFLKALFELEVPELTSGSIEIKSIAREAGSRSKVAVFSNVGGIDPIGSCVGQRGVRINSIMNELRIHDREEKIDIILWDEDIKTFLANSVSPAEVKSVKIIEQTTEKSDDTEISESTEASNDLENSESESESENKIKSKGEAIIIVPEEQLSLAIGKDGQNVRLAAKLTNWKIDIVGEESGESISSSDGNDNDETEIDDKNEENGEKEKNEDKEKQNEHKKNINSKKSNSKKSNNKEKDISQLELSKRVSTALEKQGIKTLSKLTKYKDDFTQIKGIAKKSAEEIEKALN